MDDYISRQWLMECVEEGWIKFDTQEDENRFVHLIRDIAPSAQPELIRCKDCKHRPTATRADEGIYWGFSIEFPDERCPCQCEDGWYNHYPKDDFYCANAERRADATD